MGLHSKEISTKKMVALCRQLAIAYDAGLPILRALELAANHTGGKRVHEVLQAMADEIQQGNTLAGAAKKQERYLPAYFIQLLAAGEIGGRLDVMLRDLADYYEDQLELKRGIVSSMIYPGLQLTSAWFLGTFALRLIFKLDLSSGTAFKLTAYFQGYLYFQLKAMGFLAIIVIICLILSRKGLFKWVWGYAANTIWPVNIVTRKFALTRFFRSLSLLIGSGVNMKTCITQSAALTVNPYIQRDLMQAVPLVAEGATLEQAFSNCRSLTPMAREMLVVGEHSGELESLLHKVSEYHKDEAETAVKRTVTVMNILIVLAVGLLVGYIVITFYGQLYGSALNDLL